MLRIIAIAGGPRCGKTELAKALADAIGARTLLHTDDCIPMGWSEASEYVARSIEVYAADATMIVEGVAVGRALRKLMEFRPTLRPCDVALYLRHPVVRRTEGQARMAKGCDSVWDEIVGKVAARGALVVEIQPGDRAAMLARAVRAVEDAKR